MKKLDFDLELKLKESGMFFTYPNREEFKKACLPAYEALCSKLGPKAYQIVEAIQKLN
jgi:hypothetical protein